MLSQWESILKHIATIEIDTGVTHHLKSKKNIEKYWAYYRGVSVFIYDYKIVIKCNENNTHITHNCCLSHTFVSHSTRKRKHTKNKV